MRSRVLAIAMILGAALLTALLDGRFSLLSMVAWAVFFTGLLWPWVFGRSKPAPCQPSGLFRRG